MSLCHFDIVKQCETSRKQEVASGLRLWFSGVGVASARPLAFFLQFTTMRSTCRTCLHAAIPSVSLFRSDGSQRILCADAVTCRTTSLQVFAALICNFESKLGISLPCQTSQITVGGWREEHLEEQVSISGARL